MSKGYASIKIHRESKETKDFQRHYEIESARKIAETYREPEWDTFIFRLEDIY